jgi:hypothetical protein
MAVHTVTFLPSGVTVEVDDEAYPLADHGRPGSLLDIALARDVHLELCLHDVPRHRARRRG